MEHNREKLNTRSETSTPWKNGEGREACILLCQISNAYKGAEYRVMDPHIPPAQLQDLPAQGPSYFIYTSSPTLLLAF